MTSIDKQYLRLLKSKAKVFDEIAKIKPMSNGEIVKSASNFLNWYEDDPEAFYGAMIVAIEALENADNRQLAGMRQRYRTYKRRRSPTSGRNSRKRKRRTDHDGEAEAPLSTDTGGWTPNHEEGGDDEPA
jgi:hypothetical protein